MRILDPSFTILDNLDRQSLAARVEYCGRVCYKSEASIDAHSAGQPQAGTKPSNSAESPITCPQRSLAQHLVTRSRNRTSGTAAGRRAQDGKGASKRSAPALGPEKGPRTGARIGRTGRPLRARRRHDLRRSATDFGTDSSPPKMKPEASGPVSDRTDSTACIRSGAASTRTEPFLPHKAAPAKASLRDRKSVV